MAEALINHLGRGRYRHGAREAIQRDTIHPQSIQTLQRHGVHPGQPRSKSWTEFADRPFDLVITVCDQAAGESCPLFPGQPNKLHWSTPDPAKAQGSEPKRRSRLIACLSCSRSGFRISYSARRLILRRILKIEH